MTEIAPIEELHAAPDVEVVADGLWVVRIPLPVRVAPVNAWVGRTPDDGFVVFDTGIGFGATGLWTAAFREIGCRPDDVERIIVSHHHPDHIGGAGALHALTGAPIQASTSTIDQSPGIWGDAGRLEQYFEEMVEHYRRHGVPASVYGDFASDTTWIRTAVGLPPDDAWEALPAGSQLQFAGGTWTVHDTPGHADGHLVLHDAHGSRLLSADHLLERISPAVGRFPRHSADPLGSYLQSLELVAGLDAAVVLPGHGESFSHGADRARALVAHHAERVEQCVAAVRSTQEAAGSSTIGCTAYDVAASVFARVFTSGRPDSTDRLFATTETLAHLERARFDGRVQVHDDDAGMARYVLG